MPAPRIAPRVVTVKRKVKVHVSLLIVVLLLTPFMQLGFTFYGSVATLTLLTVIAAFGSSLVITLRKFYAWLLPVPLMFASLYFGSRAGFDENFAQIVRESFFFALIVIGLKTAKRVTFEGSVSPIVKAVLVMLICLLFIELIQVFQYARGQYFGLPAELYVMNADTIAGELDLKYSRLRPAGTFGEPSYLGFYVFSLMTMFYPLIMRSRRVVVLVSVGAVIGILSQSLAFFICLCGFAALFVRTHRLTPRARGWLIAVATTVVLITLTQADLLVARLPGGSLTTDTSLQFRLWTPLVIMPQHLLEFPLGEPIADLIPNISRMAMLAGYGPTPPIDNAFTNLLFQFGLLGFVLVTLIVRATPHLPVRMYLIFSMFFNGSYLNIDKGAMILFVAIVYQLSLREAESPALATKPRRRLRVRPTTIKNVVFKKQTEAGGGAAG